jgi:sigma-B regulation protein RsbU (phosphoserine phosphatase)
MRLAGIVQRRMIPEKAPLVPGLDVAATYIPCFDVGGDLYNFHQIGDDRIVVSIADVIGKGIPAALMMSSFRGAVQAYAGTEISPKIAPEDIISKINKMACGECRDGEFITFFFAVICVGDMTITYCNCGHQPTILIRERQVTELQKGGLVLGIDPQTKYEIETIGLKDGDCLLFYTDGLIDAANFDGEFWGKERLLEAAKMFAEGSAEQVVNNILGYRRRFVGLASQRDDTSIIGVKVGKTVKPKFMK